MTTTTRSNDRRRRERGSAAIEAVIVVPAFMLFVLLIIAGGRLAIAHQQVESAAAEAARSASIARSPGQAAADARAGADRSLQSNGLVCTSTEVQVKTAGFTAPVGTATQVSATVRCTVALADLGVPGLPGSHTVAASVSSPVDTYRER